MTPFKTKLKPYHPYLLIGERERERRWHLGEEVNFLFY